MKILISGTRGNFGSTLVEQLDKNKFEIYKADILDRKDSINLLKNLNFNKFDLFIHLGSSNSRSTKNYTEVIKKNIIYNEIIFKKLSKNKKIKIIFASANSIITKPQRNKINNNTNISPIDLYSYTKLLNEFLIEKYFNKNNYLIIRFPSIYGSRSKEKNFLNTLLQNIKKNKTLDVSNPNLKFNNAVLMQNCVDFIKLLIKKPYLINGKTIQLGTKDSPTIMQIIDKFKKMLNIKKRSKVVSKIKGNYIIDISDSVKMGFIPNKFDEIIQNLLKTK